MSDLAKVCILGLAAMVGIAATAASGSRPQAIAQPTAAACRCVDCLDDSDVRRIVAEELSRLPKAPVAAAASAPAAPANAASTDPLIGKKNADGSVTVAVQYDAPAPLEAKRKLPPIRKPPMPLGGVVVDGVQGVGGGAVRIVAPTADQIFGTNCRVVNGRRICN